MSEVSGSGTRERRLLVVLLALLSLALGVRCALVVGGIAVRSERCFDWDPAGHGVDGIRMAEALRHADIAGFLRLVHEQSVHPPLYPMLQAPVFLAFGYQVHVAEVMMAVLLLFMVLMGLAAGAAMGTPRSLLAGGLAAAVMAASPMAQIMGAQVMFEVPGVVLLLLMLVFYARYRRHGRSSDARGTAITLFLMFMLKYNYAILAGVPLAINELGHSLPGPGRLAAALHPKTVMAGLRRYRYRATLGAVFLLWATVLVLRFGSREAAGFLRPATALVLIVATGGAVIHPRRKLAALRLWWNAQDALVRSVIVWAVIPAATWLALPGHLRAFVQFGVNRSSGMPLLSAENLLFYPRSFAVDYGPTPELGWALLALALAALAFLRFLSPAERFVPIAFVSGLLIATAHGFKQDRFPFTVAPLMWLSAGLLVGLLVERLGRRAGATAVLRASALAAGLMLALALTLGFDHSRITAHYEAWTTPAATIDVVDAVIDVERASNGTLLFGLWNRLPVGLFEWRMILRHSEAGAERRPRNPQWYGTRDVAALVDSAASDRQVERVVVLELPRSSPEYRRRYTEENPWATTVAAALARDARFERESSRSFPATGYQMHVFARRQ